MDAQALKRAIDAFDINEPDLPEILKLNALTGDGYPYGSRMKRKAYEKELRTLQIELLKLQRHFLATGQRMVCLFEGRDAAGKDGCISRVLQHLNKRHARAVALAKPTETERGQWYFQRYVSHFPTRGDIVLFDRSWYNRAGVERVMGFANEDEVADFLREAPQFESMLVRDGIHLFKFFLRIAQPTQMVRFHARRHDPLKTWKLSPIDIEAIEKWDEYSRAHADLFRFTHTPTCPWTVIRANDKRRARINVLRKILHDMEYEGKNSDAITAPDPEILGPPNHGV
jgi:polyphosphate kinase 2